MSAPDLQIRRLVAHCRMPAGTTAGPRVVAALEEELGAPLERALSTLDADGYWLIRRLAVRAGVGAEWTTAQMAATVAGAIGDAVRQRVRRGREEGDVLWFPDREAFVADFLLDLARGRAGGRWEYDEFAPLPEWPDAAIALAAAEPAVLQAALARLGPAGLEEVADLVRGDRLLEVVDAGGAARAPVLVALRRLRTQGRLTVTGSTGLLLAVEAVRDRPVTLADVARPALDAAELVRLVARVGGAADEVLAAVAAGRWAGVVAAAGPTDAFLPLVEWPAADRTALAEALSGAPDMVPEPRLHTRFGGGFLLLPLLPDLWSWSRATEAWPDADGVGADRLAELAVLAATSGTARFAAVLQDPLLRLALAIPDDVNVRAWLDGLEPEPFAESVGLRLDDPVDPWLGTPVLHVLAVAATAVLRDLGRRLPGMAGASPAYLWRNVLDVDAWVSLGETDAVVELGRAPLAVLLAMTGLGRADFVVGGAGERRWTLTSRC
jgi:hypothetical protein